MSSLTEPPGSDGDRSAVARPTVLHLAGVHKSFKMPHEQHMSALERAEHGFRYRGYDVLHAVNDISLDIGAGEFFGIVGRNGSGKSTLLKCLAGIYPVDRGEMAIAGRLAPFIELGVGFNPELTARDNAIINAIMLGLHRREAEARLEQIIAFAELEDFMDLRLKNYSSGMHVRLAFAVAIQVDADILLIDEVLAVGDANFQQKCFDEFARLRSEGKTIVLVTHDMGAVERFCDRAMLMDLGRVVDIGEPSDIAREYNDMNFHRAREQARMRGEAGDVGAARVLGARFVNTDGEEIGSVMCGERARVLMDVRFDAEVHDPLFGIALRDESGHSVFGTNTGLQHGPSGVFTPGETVEIEVAFDNWLAPGRYSLSAAVARNGFGADNFDLHEDAATLTVGALRSGGGAVDLPHRFSISVD